MMTVVVKEEDDDEWWWWRRRMMTSDDDVQNDINVITTQFDDYILPLTDLGTFGSNARRRHS